MSDKNSYEVALPVRQLPDGTIRVGRESPATNTKEERFSFPVVPNEPSAHTAVDTLPNNLDKPKGEP